MKIGQVGKVEVVGEVSNRLLKSASMVGIWGDREGMITTIWDNYKKKDSTCTVESTNQLAIR